MKQNKNNRFAALLLALCMAVCCALPALAAPAASANIDLSRTGSMDVTLYDHQNDVPLRGGALTVYKVADVARTNGDLHFVYTADFAGCGIALGDLTDSTLASRLEAKLPARAAGTTHKISEQGIVSFDALPLGLYLVVQTENSKGYEAINSFLVSLPMADESGWLYTVDATPKVGAPTQEVTPPEPETPSTPSEPGKPSKPEKPSEPDKPTQPDNPDMPVNPNDPNRRVKSARIDSGDLARGSKRLRKALDAAGKPYIKLVASNGLDEKKIANMELYEHAHFDSYGVGENLITSASDPVFGGVYKLVAVKKPDGSYTPKMKCSDSASKAIIPGKKMPWRLYDENGQAQCDLIAMDGEVIEAGKPVTMVNLDSDAIERTITFTPTAVRPLLVPHILGGELAIDLPSIAEKKAYIAKQLTEETWESELRLECPHKHYVNMTPAVAECRSRMYAELHGGKV